MGLTKKDEDKIIEISVEELELAAKLTPPLLKMSAYIRASALAKIDLVLKTLTLPGSNNGSK